MSNVCQEGARGTGVNWDCGLPGLQVRLDSQGIPLNPD